MKSSRSSRFAAAGKADYCLRGNGLSLVLIEVKRAGTELDAHQNQLLGYAIAEGAPIAVLTDGLNWWFYLSMSSMAAGKAWHDRRFLHVDFREHSASDGAAALDRFLDRDASVNGAAFRAAEAEFKRQERDRGVRAVLPEAWGRVLGDLRLRDLLAEKVEEVSGHPPEPETIAGFLRRISGGESVVATPTASLQPPISQPAEATTSGQRAAGDAPEAHGRSSWPGETRLGVRSRRTCPGRCSIRLRCPAEGLSRTPRSAHR